MTLRLHSSLFPALLVAVACGSEEPSPDSAPAVAAAAAVPISGMYHVNGSTTEIESGERRNISGAVILTAEGDTYSATFDLNTAFPSAEGAMSAEVIGKGSGTISGRTLTGEAQTQVVISTIPGVDPGFAFIPRRTTTRIVSKSVTEIADDGSVEIRIESSPAAGQSYAPTRTLLRGRRVSAGGIGDGAETPDSAMGEAGP